jgi:hypothetical protein
VGLVDRPADHREVDGGLGASDALDERVEALPRREVPDERDAEGRGVDVAVGGRAVGRTPSRVALAERRGPARDRLVVDRGVEPVAGGRGDDARGGVDAEGGDGVAGRRAVADDAVESREVPALDGPIQRGEPAALARAEVVDDPHDRVGQVAVVPDERGVRQLVLEHHVDVDAEALAEPRERAVDQPARVRPPRELDDFDGVAGPAEPLDQLPVVAEPPGLLVEAPVQREADPHTGAS